MTNASESCHYEHNSDKMEVAAAAERALRNNWNYDAFEFVYWNAYYIG